MSDSPGLLFQEALQQVDALEAKVDHLQWWLTLAVCFLFSGLILEYYEYLPRPLVLFARKLAWGGESLYHKHVPQKVGRCMVVVALGALAIVVFGSMRTETRLREANNEVMLSVKGRLWADGARGRYLLGDHRRALIEPLKKYGGARVEVRYCDENSGDPEITDFIGLLNAPILRASGWRINKPVSVNCQSKTGVLVQVLSSTSSQTKGAAKCLVTALMNDHLDVVGGRVLDWRDGDPLPRDSNTVVLYVFPRS